MKKSGASSQYSPRYYYIESLIWVISLCLLGGSYFGQDSIPEFFEITKLLKNFSHFFQAAGALIIALNIYISVEYVGTPPKSLPWARLLSASSLFYAYPDITAGTPYENLNPFWIIAFLAVGIATGSICSILIMATFMIRTEEESKKLMMNRIPLATKAQFIFLAPILILIITIYIALLHYCPISYKTEASIITILPIAWLSFSEYLRWISSDKRHESNATARQSLQRVFDWYDLAKGQEIQELVESTRLDGDDDDMSVKKSHGLFDFSLLLRDKFTFEIKYDQEQGALVASIDRDDGDDENKTIKVLVLPEDKKKMPFEINLKMEEIAQHAFRYIKLIGPKKHRQEKLISYALNETAVEHITNLILPSIYRAIHNGDLQQVNDIIDSKFDINSIGPLGNCPLIHSVKLNRHEITSKLLELGAKPDILNFKGESPLLCAVLLGQFDQVKLLIDYYADTNLAGITQVSPLMIASQKGDIAIMNHLISNGAKVDHRSLMGDTALDFAERAHQGEASKLLRKHMKANK